MKKKATIRTPVKELDSKETLEHYVGVRVEDMHSSMMRFMEGVKSEISAFRRDFDEHGRKDDAHFQILEAAIKCNTEAMRQMEIRLSEKIDRIAVRVDDHETRITTIESTLA